MEVKDKRNIRKSYNALGGKLYDVRYEREQRAKYDEILELKTIQDDVIVFDNGCGTGLLIERLNNPFVGVDLSYGLLLKAQSRSRARGGVHLVNGDSENLPLRPHIFKVVIAVTLIQNTPNPSRTLCEMKRIALAGSDIVVTALKKSFSLHDFQRLLSNSGLNLKTMIRKDDIKDWIALTNV